MHAHRLAAALLVGALGAALPATAADAPRPTLLSGPMVGATSLASTVIWVQTTAPADVQVRWWTWGKPETTRESAPVRTRAEDAHVAKITLSRLEAGTTYGYAVVVDGRVVPVHHREGIRGGSEIPLRFSTARRWRFREGGGPDGHALHEFRFVAASCMYVNDAPGDDPTDRKGNPYGGEFEILDHLAAQDAAFMVWLGDNMYLRENDWTHWEGITRRWTAARALPHLRPFFATVPQLATWDDHDFGPNNSDRSFWNRGQTRRAFDLFWANPSAGLPDVDGIFTYFSWGDVNLFLLDNRTHRSANTVDPRPWGERPDFLGRRQLDWLVNALVHAKRESEGRNPSYPSNFNVIAVGSQALDQGGNPDAWPTYREEWQEMIDRLVHHGIDGVVFLSGDIHRAEIARMQVVGGGEPGVPGKAGIVGATYTFAEVTTSPITAGPSTFPSRNPHRLAFPQTESGSFNTRNFAVIDVKGGNADRRLEVRYVGVDGKLLNQKAGGAPGEIDDLFVIRAADLRVRPPEPAAPAAP